MRNESLLFINEVWCNSFTAASYRNVSFRYPSPGMYGNYIPFPARIILSSANANAGYYKQYTIASSLFNIKITNVCQMPRLHALSVPADRCDVSLLYIKQLHTPPGMSCCQPLDNCTKHQQHHSTRFDNTSPSLLIGFLTKFVLRLRLHSSSVQCLSPGAVCVSGSHRLL